MSPCREVNQGGLHMLYEMILLASMLEFGAAMKVRRFGPTAFQPTGLEQAQMLMRHIDIHRLADRVS